MLALSAWVAVGAACDSSVQEGDAAWMTGGAGAAGTGAAAEGGGGSSGANMAPPGAAGSAGTAAGRGAVGPVAGMSQPMAAGSSGRPAPSAGSDGASAGAGGSTGQAGAAAGSGGSTAPDAGMNEPDAAGPDGGPSGEECAADSREPTAKTLSGNLGTHDPVLIGADGRYYLFHTGRGIPTKTSSDLTAWQAGPAVFSSNPGWIASQVPGATDLWAPDISFFGGRYHLYYSASTFGSNRSCIGHATRASLSEGSWADQGSVVCSNPGGGNGDNWNAIDPNVIVDEDGAAWLSFGSFWSGIKMIALDEAGARKGSELLSLASRPSNGGAIEAPFIIRRCGYYYLFVSFDTCCRGADSTYKTMVGRSENVRGPYSDRAGMQLMRGGGTLLVQGDSRWKGPGHNAVIDTDEGMFNVYHAYAAGDGRSMLRISELLWDAEGWPRSGGP